MWIDLNSATDFRFDDGYDVCVCGSGPAGITIARRLKNAGARVLLLEAGGLEFSEPSQEIYAGESIGPIEYYGVESCRLRYFGGASNHWMGFCTRFAPIDFEARDIWEVPGWPIGFDEVFQHQDEAKEILGIDKPIEPPPEPLWRSERLSPAWYELTEPTRFGPKYREELQTAPNLDVALNANVLDLRLDADKRAVREVIVADYAGRKFSIYPKFVVIAFGALENARFLLNAHSDIEAGLGNHSDFVGRCFMEHFDITLGRFVGFGAEIWNRDRGVGVNPSTELLKNRGLNNCFLSLTPDSKLKFYGRLAPFRKAKRALTHGNRMSFV